MAEKRRNEETLAPPQPKAIGAVGGMLLASAVTAFVVGIAIMFGLMVLLRVML